MKESIIFFLGLLQNLICHFERTVVSEEKRLMKNEIKAPTPPPTVFITKSVTSKKPTFRISWRHSMQSERQKAAKVTSPTRRQKPVRFNEASHSPQNNPNGTNTAMFERDSTGPCPLFWNMREKSSVRLCPAECFMIPKYRIPTAVSNRNRTTKTVRPKAIAPYTEYFFRIRRITVNANDTTPITAQCDQGTWERMPREYDKTGRGNIKSKDFSQITRPSPESTTPSP